MQIMKEMYRNNPEGICGNEDCGQMSAWYIMSAMGFYPVDPCGGEYELGMPLFPEVRLTLGNGKTFTVKRHFSGQSPNGESKQSEETFMRSSKARLNGKKMKGTRISHNDIMNGSILEFR